MKLKTTILICVLTLLQIIAKSQTIHIVTLPSSGTNTLDVNCAIGDIIKFQSAAAPVALKIFRNPTPDLTLTVIGTSTSYTVTATDTSYSSIVSLSPVSTCRGRIILSPATAIFELVVNNQNLIYPNPVKDMLNFKNIVFGSNVEILDITGKVCKEFMVDSNISMVNLSDLQNGLYFIRTEKFTCKFIKN